MATKSCSRRFSIMKPIVSERMGQFNPRRRFRQPLFIRKLMPVHPRTNRKISLI